MFKQKSQNGLEGFTNLYSLSKTLRFELIPQGKTKETFSKWLKDLQEKGTEENLKNGNLFAKDKAIFEAYLTLKPILDKIHEEFINNSLTSEEAKKIDFTIYLEKYRNKTKKKDEEKNSNSNDDNLKLIERKLRKSIGKTYIFGALNIKERIEKTNEATIKEIENLKNKIKKKDLIGLKKDDEECLTESGILKYIEKNVDDFVSESLSRKDILKHLEIFKGFFTYLSGYNKNRENYYETKKEQSTAIATRIVHENLPKFCDNVVLFESRKEQYKNAYQYLQNENIATQIEDAKTKKMIEVYSIDDNMFQITKFNNYLYQSGIEEYNKVIGHYNLLINLYNQAQEKKEDKLEHFKKLYKQIGCGKRKSLFFALKYNTNKEQKGKEKNSKEILNIEDLLKKIQELGIKYFTKQKTLNLIDFINWLKGAEDWNGIYWSKSAIDKISNKYLDNWFAIKEKLKGNKNCVSYDKKTNEIKVNDAVELSGLFSVIDQEKDNPRFFKESVLEDCSNLIDKNLLPSRNLINLICFDIEQEIKSFFEKSNNVLKITDYKKDENKLLIKEWLDHTLNINRVLKYFLVKERKVKGNPINAELSNMLSALVFSEDVNWTKWYDAVRNYLTKKPQDDVKDEKLQLNFGCSNLLNGWSDGEEKNKIAVLLKNGEKYYVGILKNRRLFDTDDKNNPIYQTEDKKSERLILSNLAFKTLAGKGFKSEYNVKYSEMEPVKAISSLQEFIKEKYVTDYPKLKKIIEKKYIDKEVFDKEIADILAESYFCEFTPIIWENVLNATENGELYLFELYSKDFSEKSIGKENLQTIYWKHIFEKNSTIQLCAGGKIFNRKQAIRENEKISHPANMPIYRRGDGRTESIFNHTIIKDKRFTEEKYSFHIPIKLNYRPEKESINQKVLDKISISKNLQFLGIDRGENHLVYYSLIDIDGKLIEQGSFNTINGKDYYTPVAEQVKKRRESRENWQDIGKIKNLKDGYISLVVHEIIEKMKTKGTNEYIPTFIVLEDLNTGFKRSRQKMEEQVYQKFELALAKKLNYLVDKNVKIGDIASVVKALQLTPEVKNYADIENKKQIGTMLYTRANYTSVTDPATGWRKTIYLKKGSEGEIKKQIIDNFTKIGFDGKDYFFEYEDKRSGKIWKIWSGKRGETLPRYRGKRGKAKNEWIIEPFNVLLMLNKVFENFDKSKSLLEQIKAGKELVKYDDKYTAWETLRCAIDLIQQIRNSSDTTKGQDDNFLYSPVRDEKGEHFDSRLIAKQENAKLPKDADANGAYNIARKGLIMNEHVKQWIKDGKKKIKKNNNQTGKVSEINDLDLFISDEEWDLWLLDRKKWEEKLPIFASQNEMKEYRNSKK